APKGTDCQTIFDGLDLNVTKGSFTCILGPSGCGKSTLLNIISGILQPTRADRLNVGGEDIRENSEVRRHMGYIFQHARLLPWRTLKQNVIFALKGLRIQPPERWEELMQKYFQVVGLENHMDYFPSQVSGGMQQRASIVRAWANEPRILLMDEPFSHLDEITAREYR
ncbi:MAG TPA: ATP-binding cassette domain-containing protein, partial [bacterium]|nr:ATP-binding cassette domain-containing protein [bacterium]